MFLLKAYIAVHKFDLLFLYLLQKFLSLRILNVQYLQESIFFELKISDKTFNFLSLYRSPSQSPDDFETLKVG